MWLLHKLAPDFKTIADFRRDNGPAIREVCRQFTLLCRELALFGGELVAIDGSKFKAVNSRRRNFAQRKLKNLVQRVDEKVERYLQELDANDVQERASYQPTAEELREKIETLQQRKPKYEQLQERLDQSEETQISLTDPDSRSMPVSKGRGTEVTYNVQISVDAKHKLIVDHPYIPKPDTSANSRLGLYGKRDFRYDPDNDCYWCPAGEALLVPMFFAESCHLECPRISSLPGRFYTGSRVVG